MLDLHDPSALRQVVIHATPEAVDRLPRELFFDRDLIWHEQHFGMAGHLASGTLAILRENVYLLTCFSDLVQRIGRRREHRTWIGRHFGAWDYLVRNAAAAYALTRGHSRVYFPTADLMSRNSDQTRTTGPALFRKIYDEHLARHFRAERRGDWWQVDVHRQRERVVVPRRRIAPIERRRTIALFHDVEAGYGHRREDEALARTADEEFVGRITAMHRIETAMGVSATYNVVGELYDRYRKLFEELHADLAFHSFDHVIPRPSRSPVEELAGDLLKRFGYARSPTDGRPGDQLLRCRQVDYRLKGYRPPQSVITPEITSENLAYRNFEWLASSAGSLGCAEPRLREGHVDIPVAMDDYDLYTRRKSYEQWEAEALRLVEDREFTAIGLHDCYAHLWLPGYADLLRKLKERGRVIGLTRVSDEVFLASAE